MQMHTPQWYDSMYNNRLLVPNALEHMAHWQASSKAWLSRPETVRHEFRYGQSTHAVLDVYPASSKASTDSLQPVVVFIHGGYWRALFKEDHAFLVPSFQKANACSVVVSYDLCPQVSIQDIALQMVQALVWVYKNIQSHGGDPRRIHVVGHSAGGHLAALLMTTLWRQVHAQLPKHLVHSALAISGLFELESIRRTPFLATDLRLTESSAERLSPAWIPAPEQGHLYAVHGDQESAEFARQTVLIQSAWGRDRVPIASALPGLNHFSILESLLNFDGPLFKLMLNMLQSSR